MFRRTIRKTKKFLTKLQNTILFHLADDSNAATHSKILKYFHNEKTPRTYIEIGVQEGRSIILANKKTNVIGIDPVNVLAYLLNKNIKMYFMTSDDFFKKINLEKIFKGQEIDLAFIDGMHLFEFALRDFINIEKNCHENSTVILHDTIPFNKETSGREPLKGSWTGDVFKMVLILKKYRPDLKIYNFDTAPGACVIKNLNPNSCVLKDNYNQIVEEYTDWTFDNIAEDLNQNLSIISFEKFDEIKTSL